MFRLIYQGEANIFQGQLQSFLALAQELELDGLKENLEETETEVAKNSPKEEKDPFSEEQKQKESSFSKVKKESNISDGLVLRPKQAAYIDPATSAKIASMIEKRIGGFFCNNCDYTSNHKSHIQDHVEKHIEGLEYPCSACNKVLRLALFLRMLLFCCLGKLFTHSF